MKLMDTMVGAISKEKREEMMVKMMPMMMEGIDVNEMMPKMMAAMLKDVSSDDVADYLHKTLEDKETLQGMIDTMLEANMMVKMMMVRQTSTLGFDETVDALMRNIPRHNWKIPDTRDLQALWQAEGIENPPRIKVLYLCNPQGGSKIASIDELMPMSVMMPMGLSIYETSTGKVEIAYMNLGMMSGMFTGVAHNVLRESADNLSNALKGIIE